MKALHDQRGSRQQGLQLNRLICTRQRERRIVCAACGSHQHEVNTVGQLWRFAKPFR